MSYADGIGSLSQGPGTIAPAATKSTQTVPVSKNETRQATPTSSSANPTDLADLSTASSLIATALAGSDTRTAKVEALQQAIASGNYHVSSADVADKMIQTLLDK